MENKVYQKPELKIFEVENANLLAVSNPTGETDPWEEAPARNSFKNYTFGKKIKLKKCLYENYKFFIFMHLYCDSFILF